ncbi:MAG: chromate transporter [Comamonadaceae bacterium]|jgi:chromate transporter|nr:MAG: chromate transporter [Comamonadaceae bacterium]
MHAFSWSDWLTLFLHFVSLSLLSIGGAITTVPDMHRFLVSEKSWLSDSQFTGSIALAQAAPGPNVLFVAVLGWNIGMNAGGGLAGGASAWGMAFAGVFATMLGILLPSTTLTFFAARWGHQNKERRDVRAFKMAMAPIVVALLMATGWVLTAGHGPIQENLWLWVLTLVSTLVVWQTRIHLLWLLAAGALGGVMGWF